MTTDRMIVRTGPKEVLRRNRRGELEYLTFPALEETGLVKHLFTTRTGGVSQGIYESMNLSFTRGDRPEAVAENFRRIAKVMEGKPEDMVCSDQTHTVNVRTVTERDRGKGVTRPKDYQDVDGLITDQPNIILGTFYADCVPLFFVDKKRRAIGLSHSGWRGTVKRMGSSTLEAMKEAYGTRPEDVVAAIGPSICKSCYEVSTDVAKAFREAFDQSLWDKILTFKGGDKYLLDLWKATEYVLLEAGVPKAQISVADICTCCNPGYLFSHRASQGRRGNLGAFLALLEKPL